MTFFCLLPCLVPYVFKSIITDIMRIHVHVRHWIVTSTVPPTNFLPRKYSRIFEGVPCANIREYSSFTFFFSFFLFFIRIHLNVFGNIRIYSNLFDSRILPIIVFIFIFLFEWQIHSNSFKFIREYSARNSWAVLYVRTPENIISPAPFGTEA